MGLEPFFLKVPFDLKFHIYFLFEGRSGNEGDKGNIINGTALKTGW
jgi:hypothetical protein